MNSDATFWDRIHDMPPCEAELECTLRREENSLKIAMLQKELVRIMDRTGVKTKEWRSIGVEISKIGAQNTLLNERAKYLRRLMDKLQWKEAIRAIYGDDGVAQCAVWIEQQYRHEVSTKGQI